VAAEEVGRVLAIAVWDAANGRTRNLSRAVAIQDGGLAGDAGPASGAGVTLLASRQWQAVMRALGTVLLWHARRANILVDCPELRSLIGKTVHVGAASIRIEGEAAPEPWLNDERPGLLEALRFDGAAGVRGRVLVGGTISVGDSVTVSEPTETRRPALFLEQPPRAAEAGGRD